MQLRPRDRVPRKYIRPQMTKRNVRVRTRLPPWRRSADRTRLQANSLLTGNFAILGRLEAALKQETAVLQPLLGQFPAQVNTDYVSGNREVLASNREFVL